MTQNPTTGHISRENHNSKRCMHPNVHCSTIYNSQVMETTSLPTDRRMDKGDVVHIYNGILAIKRNKIGSFVKMWMDLETVIQSEVSQKNKYHILTHICRI